MSPSELGFFALAIAVACPARAEHKLDFPATSPSCAAWAQGGLVRFDGRFTDPATGRIERLNDAAGGRTFQHEHRSIYDVAEGDDGSATWSQDKSGASHPLNSAFAKRLAISERWVTRRGWCDPDHRGTPMKHLAEPDHAPDVGFVATPAGGTPIELHFEKGSGQLTTIVEQLDSSRLIRSFSNWARIPDGRWFARREIDELPEDEDRMDIDFMTVTPAPSSAAILFKRPLPPNDFSILGGKSSTTIAYQDDGRRRVFVDVYVNGQGPLLFELDSGGHLILTAEAATKLGITPQGSENSLGAGEGILKAGFARIGSLRIGNAVIQNQPVKILPLPPATNDRRPGLPRAGILGLELFERFSVQLDRRHKLMTLRLPQAHPAPCPTSLPLSFTEDAPEIAGAFDGVAGAVELDVGNAGPAIVEGNFAKAHGLEERLQHGIASTGGGVGGTYSDTLSRGAISLGPFRLPGEVVSYIAPLKRGADTSRSIALNAGEPVLSRFDITFDYLRNRVCLRQLDDQGPLGYLRSGLQLRRTETEFIVDGIVPGSPAQESGFRVGDRIASVDGQQVMSMSEADMRRSLGHAPGTIVKMTILRAPSLSPVGLSLTLREMLP